MKKEDLIPGHLYHHDNGYQFIIEYLSISGGSVSASRYLTLDEDKIIKGPSHNFTALGSIAGFRELTQEELIIWKTAIGEPIECEPLLYN
jgi:hypothetical protein